MCQSFRCIDFDGGYDETHRYLAVDMAIDCLSFRYRVMTGFAAVMVAIYPLGAPLVLFVMLWKQRHRLYPPVLRELGTQPLEAQVIDERRRSGILEDEPITEFAMIFKPR